MKNVNVLLAVVLCAGLCVLFGLFNRSADESLGWSPNDMYMQSILSSDGSSFTSANLSDGNVSNDGVAVSMRNGSFSLRTRVRHASSPSSLVANGVPEKSVDFLGALSPSSPIANGVPGKSADFWGAFSPNSLIGYMTSSAEYHSFGGGSNMSMGSYTSSSNSLIASSLAIGSYSQSPIAYNPIASSPNASGVGFNNLPSLQGGDGGRPVVSAEQALMSASSSASGLFGGMMTSYGTASYDQTMYGSYGSAPSGIHGRQNAGPGTAYDSWLAWLDEYANLYGSSGGTDTWNFDNEQAYNAFLAWFKETYGRVYNPEDPTGGLGVPVITYEQWLSWFTSNGGTHEYDGHHFNFTPVGNIIPLLLMALLYMIILFVKRNKTVQL